MECFSAIKRNEIELFVVRWMDLESVIQSEVSQKEKNKYRMLTHIYEILKKMVLVVLSLEEPSTGLVNQRSRQRSLPGAGVWGACPGVCALSRAGGHQQGAAVPSGVLGFPWGFQDSSAPSPASLSPKHTHRSGQGRYKDSRNCSES